MKAFNRLDSTQRFLPHPRKSLGGIFLFAIALLVVGLSVWPVRAAVELAYYTAKSTERSVLLEWGTVREINLDGFKVLCKRSDEPESKYHVIGSRIGQGGPESGANYSFEVTSGITYGESYCFRLEEVTTDDRPGEQFDLCGYGPGVTPAAVTAVVTPTQSIQTPTALIVSPGDVSPAPTLNSTTPTATFTGSELTLTPTVPGSTSPLDTPTPTATLAEVATVVPASEETATPTAVSQSPLQLEPSSPLPTPLSDVDAVGSVAQASQPQPPTDTPTPVPTVTPVEATDVPEPTPTEPPQIAVGVPPGSAPPEDTGGTGAIFTPTPIYLVVTATPTAEAVVLAPTFTPLPLATAVAASNLYDFLTPSTQNLMVMLLCLIFLTASGLGTLGLVTTIIYMRSQNQRDRFPSRYFERRR